MAAMAAGAALAFASGLVRRQRQQQQKPFLLRRFRHGGPPARSKGSVSRRGDAFQPDSDWRLPYHSKLGRTFGLKRSGLLSIRESSCVVKGKNHMASSNGNSNFLEQIPPARRDDSVVDDYHGTEVPDPYRWLEDPDSKETKEFVERQVEVTSAILEKATARSNLKAGLTTLVDHAKYDCPFKRGKKYFYLHNKGLQPQSVLYVQDSLDSEAKVLLDPNTLSEDGTVSVSVYAVSKDAKYLAFGTSSSGSDWLTIKLLRIEDQSYEPDVISWMKFSTVKWTHDNKGFFYSRYPAPTEKNLDEGTETTINLHHQVYYHFIGTPQSEDILCWKDSDNSRWMFTADVTDDGKYLLLSLEEGCDPVNRLYYCALASLPGGLEGFKGNKELLPFQKLVDNFDAQYQYVANDDTVFTFLTNKDAPKYKLSRVDLNNPTDWKDVIPESKVDVLSCVDCVNYNQLAVCYLRDVKHVLQIRSLETGAELYELPLEIGSVTKVSGKRSDSEMFFGFSSFLSPSSIYRCDLATANPKPVLFRECTVKNFDRRLYETKQVFVPGKDGTKIPMFLVMKKGTELNGENPTLLEGYGGFNISLTPWFSATRISVVRHFNAIYALANIRGGGEYGEEWHKAGALSKKQNCFDDFQACARFLITESYTKPSKLCIEGGSNGGLLIAACINQAPELFGCALAHVGVMDMLRFHKFTIGHAWTTDFGCSDNAEDFKWLIRYSPLHNVRRPWETPGKENVQYPPMMLLTADHDDRVVPLHSLKLLATLQYELYKVNPGRQINYIIGRIDTKAGHGAGRPTQKIIDQVSDAYSYFAMVCGAEWTD